MSGILLVAALTGISPAAIPEGSSRIDVDVAGIRLAVYTYKPATYKDGPLILVFHGISRNADEYRDHARRLGDRVGP